MKPFSSSPPILASSANISKQFCRASNQDTADVSTQGGLMKQQLLLYSVQDASPHCGAGQIFQKLHITQNPGNLLRMFNIIKNFLNTDFVYKSQGLSKLAFEPHIMSASKPKQIFKVLVTAFSLHTLVASVFSFLYLMFCFLSCS